MLCGTRESRRPIRGSGLKIGLLFSLGIIAASKGVLAQEDVTSAKPKTEQDNVFKSEKGYDPVKDLCQRYGQQTVIAQDTLYIDGGLWVNKDQANGKQIRDIQPLQSQYLIQVDLSKSFEVSNSSIYSPYNKPSVIANTYDGYLFGDHEGKSFNLYGGVSDRATTVEDKVPVNAKDFKVYTYYADQMAWERNVDSRPLDAGIHGYAHGAGATLNLPDQSFGFYFGGVSNRGSDPRAKEDAVSSGNLLKWDLKENKWDNTTTKINARVGASLVAMPNVGLKGALVLLGGREQSNGLVGAANMDTIHVYDVESGSWYEQTAVAGNKKDGIPSRRMDFCTGLGTAMDYSSNQIFVYGGTDLSEADPSLLDDIWMLTLPTFQWIKVDVKDSANMTPRSKHSCEVYRSQMMVIGGDTFPPGDDNSQRHALASCPASQFGIFDMNSLKWVDSFDPSHESYKVPLPVTLLIGGPSNGPAKRKSPPGGFDDNGLKDVFAKKPIAASRDPPSTSISSAEDSSSESGSTSSGSRPVNVGMIVGATIAGMCLLLLLIAIPLFFLWRRRKQRREGKTGKGGKYQREKSRGQPHGKPKVQTRGHKGTRGKGRSRGVAQSEAGASNPDTWFSGDEKEDEDIMTPLNENWAQGSNYPPAPRRVNTESSDSGTVHSMGDRQQRPRTVEISPDTQVGPFAQSAEIVNDFVSDRGIYVEDSASQRGGFNAGPATSVRDLMSVATMSSDALPQHYPYHHHHHHPSQQYQNQTFHYPQLNPRLQHVVNTQHPSAAVPNSPTGDNISPVSPQSPSGPSELDISPMTRSPRVKITDFYYSQQRPAVSKRESSAPSTRSDTSEATVVSPGEPRWNTQSAQSSHNIPRKPVSNRTSTASPTPGMVS